MSALGNLDRAGRPRSPATMPGYQAGRPPANKGKALPGRSAARRGDRRRRRPRLFSGSRAPRGAFGSRARARERRTRSSEVRPGRPPASRSSWATQLRSVWPEIPRSLAIRGITSPELLTRRTASARNSGGYGGRERGTLTPFGSLRLPTGQVSTKAGQVHIASRGPRARVRRNVPRLTRMPSEHPDVLTALACAPGQVERLAVASCV